MKRNLIIVVTLLIVFFLITCANARVGGGHSFGGGSHRSGGGYHGGGSYHSSGGSRHSSYSGGGGGEPSCAGFFILILVVAIIAFSKYQAEKNASADMNKFFNKNRNPYSPQQQPRYKRETISDSIRSYKYKDPNFSKPLFLDFIQILYTKVQIARGTKSWDSLRPYLSKNVVDSYKPFPESVSDVIIGSSNVVRIDIYNNYHRIEVQFEANYAEYVRGTGKIYYVKENWCLKRKSGVLSKGPEEISSFHCPSCGSPVELRDNDTCKYCDKVVTGGDFHWQLDMITVCEKYPRRPLQIGGGGVEEGTDLPTVFQPGFESAKRAFLMRYPNFNPKEFAAKVRDTFFKLQHAWSTCNWEEARPLETDYLFSMHKYWIEQYKAEGMRNCLEDIEILSITTVKIEQDAFYEAITVRVKATMKDYTVNRHGAVVDGNKSVKRTFSEYWTFIRRAGFAGDTKEKKENTCPNCGGELHISMAGICEYCGGKITSGNFDWILSVIEQDEVYEG